MSRVCVWARSRWSLKVRGVGHGSERGPSRLNAKGRRGVEPRSFRSALEPRVARSAHAARRTGACRVAAGVLSALGWVRRAVGCARSDWRLGRLSESGVRVDVGWPRPVGGAAVAGCRRGDGRGGGGGAGWRQSRRACDWGSEAVAAPPRPSRHVRACVSARVGAAAAAAACPRVRPDPRPALSARVEDPVRMPE